MLNTATVQRWFQATVIDLVTSLKWSYAPPLMVYLSAGLQGFSAVVATFFVKEYLSLSAALLAGLMFWASLPWALKIPLGHLVDIIWKWKSTLVFLGAGLIGVSLLIMYGLIAHTAAMQAIMPVEAWFILSTMLSPIGYVVQDVVADAMTIEAVPIADSKGQPFSEDEIKAQHTTMQSLGRLANFFGIMVVALFNVTLFSGVDHLTRAEKADIYAQLYLLELLVPIISIAGVIINHYQIVQRRNALLASGIGPDVVESLVLPPHEETKPNWWIFGGTAVFAVFTLAIGLAKVPAAQEITFVVTATIVVFVMVHLIRELDAERARMLIGTAAIVFVFRATPLPGPALSWFEIDVLGFNQQFLAYLEMLTALLTLVGIILLRPMIANYSIAKITVILSIAAGFLAVPSLTLYYGGHHVLSRLTSGFVDSHTIAFVDTALESPLDQVAMIPLLAWIARNAPTHLKATFFAVMASFVNLALSASNLFTKYLNKIFVVSREIEDTSNAGVIIPADYTMLGWLLISVAVISVVAPLIAVWLVQRTRYRTTD